MYPTHAVEIRQLLLEDQAGFCAYSEKYVWPTDAADIEHFDRQKKSTPQDGYWNWYAVIHWMNMRKARTVPQPLLDPWNDGVGSRIRFDGVVYVAVDPDDTPAVNLISYLGLNREELVTERLTRIRLLGEVFRSCDDRQQFLSLLRRDRELLSFISALEVVFELSAAEVRSLLGN